MAIRKPVVTLSYDNVDITNDISDLLLSLQYTDKISADSPDLDVVLSDREQLFQNEWFPEIKAKLSVTFKYDREQNQIEANDFEIDKIDFSFTTNQGDVVRLGAQQTPFSSNLRQKKSEDYENKSLEEIFKIIADRQGLTIVGVVPNVTFERLTQNEQSDLEFITKLAQDYGNIVKIQGSDLIVYSWSELDAQPASFTVTRENINGFRVEKKLDEKYKSAKISYQKPEAEEPTEIEVQAERKNDSDDVLVLNNRVESVAQAELIAKEKLRAANADEFNGNIDLEGEYFLLAGININIEGFGEFDGKWQIQEAQHSFNNNAGWGCRLTVFRL